MKIMPFKKLPLRVLACCVWVMMGLGFSFESKAQASNFPTLAQFEAEMQPITESLTSDYQLDAAQKDLIEQKLRTYYQEAEMLAALTGLQEQAPRDRAFEFASQIQADLKPLLPYEAWKALRKSGLYDYLAEWLQN